MDHTHTPLFIFDSFLLYIMPYFICSCFLPSSLPHTPSCFLYRSSVPSPLTSCLPWFYLFVPSFPPSLITSLLILPSILYSFLPSLLEQINYWLFWDLLQLMPPHVTSWLPSNHVSPHKSQNIPQQSKWVQRHSESDWLNSLFKELYHWLHPSHPAPTSFHHVFSLRPSGCLAVITHTHTNRSALSGVISL